MSRFSPILEDLPHLPAQLNNGENRVLNALTQLDDDWTVYVQPKLLMDNPDFVVVHDRFGVCAIEVKDWRRGIYRQRGDENFECHTGGYWQKTDERPNWIILNVIEEIGKRENNFGGIPFSSA